MEFNELEEQEYERHQQRIEEMKEEIARMSGISDCTHLSPDVPEGYCQRGGDSS